MRILRRGDPAFTIVELLVAAAITVVIVVLLGTMFGSLIGTTNKANQRIDSFRDARAALQMMRRDLSGIVRTTWRPDPFTTPPGTNPQPITKPVAYLAMKQIYPDPGSGNQQIYALVTAKNTGSGDVCSVGYYCSWENNAYTLRRFFQPSNTTFNIISTATTPFVPACDVAEPPGPATEHLFHRPSAADDALAAYVWNLKFTPYDATGTKLTDPATNLSYPYVCDKSETQPVAPPASITISFRAMSSNAARAVVATGAGPDVWMDENSDVYKRMIRPHVYEFRSQIKL
ncbi:MAG: PulJ/GspJ family protein [Chthoniobacterales bacterium]